MTVYEWRVTDLGDRGFGYIWISRRESAELADAYEYRIYVDPINLDGMVDVIFSNKYAYDALAHALFNTELPDCSVEFQRILKYWQSRGSPVLNRETPGYQAPWFPWPQAGFSEQEAT